MKTFKDNTGRQWTVELNVAAAKRVKTLLNVDLLALDKGDPPLITRLGTDVILLCDVMFALIKPQADQAGVSDEQFGGALGGDVVLTAQTALYEEIIDFFGKMGRRDLVKAVTAQKRVIDLAIAGVERRIGEIDLASEVEKTLGGSSTSSPGSSASIQAP